MFREEKVLNITGESDRPLQRSFNVSGILLTVINQMLHFMVKVHLSKVKFVQKIPGGKTNEVVQMVSWSASVTPKAFK